ncbi:hypothetical protein FZEAL_3556 [Fusarium zealandicum]|uniref:Zn(2)-C6 fungal-type domain-containing protein n=1 Tax=Fusarium zealandicum TaxID=1053134 RepID=A0A8H4XLP3_9HYPO|nr:hypothetical protein FZEAL_3556 [Fusarium zealandicum]
MAPKTVAFLGASTGVGLTALKHTLAAGHRCIALCRTPSKLADVLPSESNPNLHIVQGNARDVDAVSRCLKQESGTLVDEIVFTIGGKPILHKMTVDDPEVCRKGMSVLLESLAQLRLQGSLGRPLIVVCSTTGMSRFGRDVPLLMVPLYHVMLKVPHEDKTIMEDKLVGSGEDFTIVRASLLVDGESEKAIRVGVEDPKTGRESDAIGYTISREDVGKWIAGNLLLKRDPSQAERSMMSSGPPARNEFAPGSASVPENNASSAIPSSKVRSCVVCRSRKVRCDKLSPCSNCRRANIPCVVPSNDRPPRWARRLGRVANTAYTPGQDPSHGSGVHQGNGQMMERVRNLESLVKELRGQLDQANITPSPTGGSSVDGTSSPETKRDGVSPSSTSTTSDAQKHFGRLVLQDTSHSRYVASGFWSRISDELDGLKTDARWLAGDEHDESSDDENLPSIVPSTRELERPPSERHAFLFRQNLTTPTADIRDLRPLPSQVPFLLDIFSDSVNAFGHVLHMPSIRDMVRPCRGSPASLSPANEALMFSIYYAAVTSMEDEDVLTNFGATKAELNLKFRLGLEHALAAADFLSDPNLTLVQAFIIFLLLVRRHDSPRYVWMMTGLLIRMAHAIGLHRDGSRFEHLTPFEVEQRRRAWWMVLVTDVRASEDQGSEFSITNDSFDTKMPLNINERDLGPDMEVMPQQRQGVTYMSFTLAVFEISDASKQMMASSIRGGGLSLEEQVRLLNNLRDKLERGYFQYSPESNDIVDWVGVTCSRLVLSKMTLFIYLPALFASPNERFSDVVRDKLLVAAIETAEFNHALNAEQDCRQWRWVYQTYTHWYAIVYLLVEICRRQWSPVTERAWIALQSPWLIPSQQNLSANLRVWVPLRRLMAKTRKHREMELARIRGNASAIEFLEGNDQSVPVPTSSGPFPTGESAERFLEHWRGLVSISPDSTQQHAAPQVGKPDAFQSTSTDQDVSVQLESFDSACAESNHYTSSQMEFGHANQTGGPQDALSDTHLDPALALLTNPSAAVGGSTMLSTWWPSEPLKDVDFSTWMSIDPVQTFDTFTDMDVNLDLEGEVDWNSWLQSAASMDLNMG